MHEFTPYVREYNNDEFISFAVVKAMDLLGGETQWFQSHPLESMDHWGMFNHIKAAYSVLDHTEEWTE